MLLPKQTLKTLHHLHRSELRTESTQRSTILQKMTQLSKIRGSKTRQRLLKRHRNNDMILVPAMPTIVFIKSPKWWLLHHVSISVNISGCSHDSSTPATPKPGYFKLNVDDALNDQMHKVGIVAVVTNSKGDIVDAMSSPFDGNLSPLLAEAKALLCGLRWCIVVRDHNVMSHNLAKGAIRLERVVLWNGDVPKIF
ncbi:hypothetical protein F8388_007347 [Cannabis sativa]|uniref:RNase H type-1 domain-containing protein n=1 Tax=Cannabis sativa TaxID=3483 RepID=A0A7J6FHN6_CANSA|nr:hypothetical protein F8388_007347 [Cannabis sativa]